MIVEYPRRKGSNAIQFSAKQKDRSQGASSRPFDVASGSKAGSKALVSSNLLKERNSSGKALKGGSENYKSVRDFHSAYSTDRLVEAEFREWET